MHKASVTILLAKEDCVRVMYYNLHLLFELNAEDTFPPRHAVCQVFNDVITLQRKSRLEVSQRFSLTEFSIHFHI